MKNICVLFGGDSAEYKISCSTAKNIIGAIDKQKYFVYVLGITKNGDWLLYNSDLALFDEKRWLDYSVPAFISPVKKHHGIVCNDQIINIDMFVIAMHGKYGEDGAIQGLLNFTNIPYIGASVEASALCFNKRYFKMLVDEIKIPQARWFSINAKYIDDVCKRDMDNEIQSILSYPVFIKPAKGGSSLGVALCNNIEGVVIAMKKAAQFDSTIIIEEKINAIEVECAIIRYKSEMDFLPLSHLEYASDFYDYDAKYKKARTKLIIPAQLRNETSEVIFDYAKQLCELLDIQGLCRLDFFVENETNQVFINEINTQPGIAAEQVNPNLWKYKGSLENTFTHIITKILEKETK